VFSDDPERGYVAIVGRNENGVIWILCEGKLPLGLWEVSRNGSARAIAVRDGKSDSFLDLAILLRLDEEQAGFWLRSEQGTQISKQDLARARAEDSSFSVPNTLVIVVGESLHTGHKFVHHDAQAMKAAFEGAGFNVVLIDSAKFTGEQVNNKLGDLAFDMWGFAYFGHGYGGQTGPSTRSFQITKKLLPNRAFPERGFAAHKFVPGEAFGFSIPDEIPMTEKASGFIRPDDISRPFKRGLVSVLACYSNEGRADEHWDLARSRQGRLFTVSGMDLAFLGYRNFVQCSDAASFFLQAIPPSKE